MLDYEKEYRKAYKKNVLKCREHIEDSVLEEKLNNFCDIFDIRKASELCSL